MGLVGLQVGARFTTPGLSSLAHIDVVCGRIVCSHAGTVVADLVDCAGISAPATVNWVGRSVVAETTAFREVVGADNINARALPADFSDLTVRAARAAVAVVAREIKAFAVT